MPPPGICGIGDVLLGLLGDHRLGRDEQARHGSGILQRDANDLHRIDNAGRDEIDIFAGLRVVALVVVLLLKDLAGHDGAVLASVRSDNAGRSLDRAADDVDASLLVLVLGLQAGERVGRAEQRHAATGKEAFLDSRAGRVQRIVDAVLLLLHLDLGRTADADHRNAARELGETLLQLLLVVVRGGVLDLGLDLSSRGPRSPYDRQHHRRWWCRPS